MEHSSRSARPFSITEDPNESVDDTHSTFPGSSRAENPNEHLGDDPPKVPESIFNEVICEEHDCYKGDGVCDEYWESEWSIPKGQRYHAWDGSEFENLEDLEQYRPGGHHPVVVGDFLGEDSRFQVWHKLGQGTYGLIWLCRDVVRGKFCAVKVLRAELSAHADKLPELKVQEMLGGVSTEEAWDNHIAMPLQTFVQNGPNGEHLCIVSKLLGPSITESRGYNWNNTPFLKDICFQLVKGMNFMHSHGLCHGDFRPSNILFKTRLEDLTEEEMEIYLPDPEAYEIVAIAEGDPDEPACGPHAPLYAIEPLKLYLHDECITQEIAIIDFGVAFEAANPTIPTAIPDKYAAPECQPELGSQQPSIGSDLWALGCTMIEVLCGETPFEFAGTFSFEEMEKSLGPMPEPYRSRFVEYCQGGYTSYRLNNTVDPSVHLLWDTERLDKQRERVLEEYGTDDGLYKVVGFEACNPHPNSKRKPPKTISASVAASTDRTERLAVPEIEGTPPGFIKRRLDSAAIPGAVDLLRQVLRWFPEERVAANKLLEHEWFEGRCHQKSSSPQQPTGPTFEDILMEDVPLPKHMSVKREDLPPTPQPPAGGALVGPQTWRVNDLDLLHVGPFVPKSIWGVFQKALCAKPRK